MVALMASISLGKKGTPNGVAWGLSAPKPPRIFAEQYEMKYHRYHGTGRDADGREQYAPHPLGWGVSSLEWDFVKFHIKINAGRKNSLRS